MSSRTRSNMEDSQRRYGVGVESEPAESRAWQLTKLALNTLLLMLSMTGMSMGLSFTRFTQEPYVVMLVAGYTTVFGIGLIVSAAEFLHRFIKRDSIAPLILLSLYIVSAAAFLVFGGWMVWIMYDYNGDLWYSSTIPKLQFGSMYSYDVQLIAFGFLVTSFVVSLILFIGVSVDTHRKLKRCTAQRKMAERPELAQGALVQVQQRPPTYYFQDDNSEYLGEVVFADDEPEKIKNEKSLAKPKKAYSS